MTDVRQLLTEALNEEPRLELNAADVTRRAGRRAVARRVGGVASGALVLVTAAGVLLDVHDAGSSGSAVAGDRAAMTPTAAVSVSGPRVARRTADDVITAQSLPGIVEARGRLALRDVTSQYPDATSYVILAAAITGVDGVPAEGQYLNVQVFPGTEPSLRRSCAEMSDLTMDGDGYSGPCTASTLSDGSYLVERSGATATGGFTMTEVTLIRSDGSGVTAEATNQKYVPAHHHDQSVVSVRPPVSSAALAGLVTQLGKLELQR